MRSVMFVVVKENERPNMQGVQLGLDPKDKTQQLASPVHTKGALLMTCLMLD